jgi:predicted N-acetyltransferase YhbS
MELAAMIRDATPDDAKALILMGQAFFEEAGLPERFRALERPDIQFCPESFILSCQMLSEKGLLLVAEAGGEVVGMLGAVFAPALWNHRIGLAHECWWYVRPDKRKGIGVALLGAYEKRAAERGIALSAMVAEHGLRGDAVGRLYRAKDYVPAETVYWHRLDPAAAEQEKAA